MENKLPSKNSIPLSETNERGLPIDHVSAAKRKAFKTDPQNNVMCTGNEQGNAHRHF